VSGGNGCLCSAENHHEDDGNFLKLPVLCAFRLFCFFSRWPQSCFLLDLPSFKDIIIFVVEKSKCLSVGGKFGLRQLQWTVVRYRNLKIWELHK